MQRHQRFLRLRAVADQRAKDRAELRAWPKSDGKPRNTAVTYTLVCK
jgi:hypothetical protein